MGNMTHLIYKTIFPLYLMLMPLIACVAVPAAIYASKAASASSTRRHPTALCLSLLMIAVVTVQLVIYIVIPGYFDYAEPAVTVMTKNLESGFPLYHLSNKDGVYIGLLYGPMTFLLQLPFLVIDNSIESSKTPGVLAFIVSLLILYRALRRIKSHASKCLLIGYYVAIVTAYDLNVWYWDRPDPYILLICSVCLLLADRRYSISLKAIGFCGGLMVDLKLHAPAYLIPIFCIVLFEDNQYKSINQTIQAAIWFLIGIAIPLALTNTMPNIYAENIAVAAHQPFSLLVFLSCMPYVVLYGVPPCWMLWRTPSRIYAIVLLLSSLCVSIVASHVGSGAPHLMPFAITSAYLVGSAIQSDDASNSNRAALASMTVVAVLLMAPSLIYVFWKKLSVMPPLSQQEEMAGELTALAKEFPRSEVGLGAGEARSFSYKLRPIARTINDPSIFDEVHWWDLRFAGESIDKVDSILDTCKVRSWIIPNIGEPFSATDFGIKLFSPTFQHRFMDRYRIVMRGHYYNVWTCRMVGSSETAFLRSRASPGRAKPVA
jgi:hypothetical protein